MTSLEQLAQIERLGVFTDIDGTLSEIAPTPDSAYVEPACIQALRDLAPLVTVVAAITGRAPADAYRMVGVDELVYVGNHGLERWVDGEIVALPAARPYVRAVNSVLTALEQHDLPSGVLLENKGVTASIHYRQTAEPLQAATQLEAVLRPLCQQHDLRLMPGRMIFELRPPLELHKGTAIKALIDEYALQGAVFIGDDITDVDGFRVLQTARNTNITTLSIGVTSAETPAAVREHSDQHVAGIGGVVAWLQALIQARRVQQ